MFKQEITATLQSVNLISIHGQRYYDIRFTMGAADNVESRKTRAPYEEVYRNLSPGDKVRIHAIMGTVTKIDKLETGSG